MAKMAILQRLQQGKMVENVFFLTGLKKAKNMQKTNVKTHYSWFIKEATRKNASSSRNEKFFQVAKMAILQRL